MNQYLLSEERKTNLNVFWERKQSNEQLKNALRLTMKKCVQHHLFIKESCAMLEELFNPFCWFKSLQITFQLCLLVFVGVAVK